MMGDLAKNESEDFTDFFGLIARAYIALVRKITN